MQTAENEWGSIITDRLPEWLVPEGIRHKVGPYDRRLEQAVAAACAWQAGLLGAVPAVLPSTRAVASPSGGSTGPPLRQESEHRASAGASAVTHQGAADLSELVDWRVFASRRRPDRTYFTDQELPEYKQNFAAFFDGHARPPWRRLMRPLAAWGIFSVVLYLTFFCMMSLFRKQWVENERLTFPILVVPLAISEGGGNVSLFKNRLFLLGFVIAFAYMLHFRIPGLPKLMLAVNLQTFLVNKPWNTIPSYMVILAFNLPTFALAFFVPKDIILSFLVFNVLMVLLYPFGSAMGWGQGNPQSPIAMGRWPFFGEVGFGAFTGVFLMGLWLGRRHLRDIALKALTGARNVDDSGEPMPYRVAFFGTVAGFGSLVAFAGLAGMKVPLAAVFLAIFFVYILGITRVRAESALPATLGPDWWSATPDQLFRAYVGVENIDPRSMAVMGNLSWICQTPESTMPPHQIEGFKLVHESRGDSRKLLAAMIATVLVALPVSVWAIWSGFYYTGEASVPGNKPSILSSRIHRGIAADIRNKRPVDTPGIVATSAGLAFCIFLGIMRSRFLWWPFHPVGLALAWSYWINVRWFSWFLAWVAKSLTLKYGGAVMYRKFLYLCIGLLVGTYVDGVAGIVITLIHAKGAIWGSWLFRLLA